MSALCIHFDAQHTLGSVQALAGAAHVQALKTQRMKVAAEAGKAPAPHEENVLTHWVRSAADMRLKVCCPQRCTLAYSGNTRGCFITYIGSLQYLRNVLHPWERISKENHAVYDTSFILRR